MESKHSNLVSDPHWTIYSKLKFALTADSQSKSTIVNTASVEETRATHDWFEANVGGPRYG